MLVAWSSVAYSEGLMIFGSKEESGGSDAFERIFDLRTGHERMVEMQGDMSTESGFDGRFWNLFNGAMNVIDLPPEVSDHHAERWLLQNIGSLTAQPNKPNLTLQPTGASKVSVHFGTSKRPDTAEIDSDFGPISFAFSAWRRVGKLNYPFEITRSTNTGEKLTWRARSARYVTTVTADLLARPMIGESAARLAAPAVVPLKMHGSGMHIFVDATVEGKAGEFNFDTGAANIFTTEALQARGRKPKGGFSVSGVGEGSVEGGFAMMKTVSLGAATLYDQNFIVIPSFFPKTPGETATEGLLGYEFFAHYVTTIDYEAKTMTFRNAVPADQKGVRLPFYSDGHSIYVHAQVNGHDGVFRLDTGDGGSVTLFPNFAARMGIAPVSRPESQGGGGAGGGVKEAGGQVDSFSFGGLTLDKFPVRLASNNKGAFASRYLAGNLGGRLLSCFRITFDHARHQMWLEPQTDTPTCQVGKPTTARGT